MTDGETRTSGRIFISYRREETAYPAGWLADRLTERFGRGSVFKDVDSIAFGDDFAATIATAVGSCDVLLALIGPRWLTATDEHGRRRLELPDDFVRREIETALTRSVRVIPILVDGARMPGADDLPPTLAPLAVRQALDINPSRFASDTARLVAVLETTLHEQRSAPAPPVGTAPAPRARRIALGIGAVAVLVAGGVVVLSQHPGTGGPTAPSTAPAGIQPSTTGPIVTGAPVATTTPPPDAGPVLLSDDFSSDVTGWTPSGESGTTGRLVDGAYRLQLAPLATGTGAGVFPESAAGLFPVAPPDVVIEATVTRVSTAPMDAGLMCRADKGTGYGYFMVLSQGAAEINKASTDHPFTTLQQAALPFDVSGPHRLRAECRDQDDGVHLSVTVDDRLHVEVVDINGPLRTGSVGLFMSLPGAATNPGVARYDDVTVRG